ncbi:hypothetical protein [Streptomyces sp. NPDC007206]|uniref:hypothetical protein n=1 Tax=Streptomyces sp. NPDC007206 TaxID=3154317 RepID=UPI0033EAF756
MESEVIATLISTPVGGLVGYLAARATRSAGRDQADGSRDAAQIASSAQHTQWEREQRLTTARAFAEAAHSFLAAARPARQAGADGESAAARDVYASVMEALDTLDRHTTAVTVPGPADVARAAHDVYARAVQLVTALLRQDACRAHAHAADALHRVIAAVSDYSEHTAEIVALADSAFGRLGEAHARIDAAHALGLIDEDSTTRGMLHSATVTVAAVRNITRTAIAAATESAQALDDAEAAVTYAAAATGNALRRAIIAAVGEAWVRMHDNPIDLNGASDAVCLAYEAIRNAGGPPDAHELHRVAEQQSRLAVQEATAPILEVARNPAAISTSDVRIVEAQVAAFASAPPPEPYVGEPESFAATRGRRRTASMIDPDEAPAAVAYAVNRLARARTSVLAHQWSHHAARALGEAIAADPAAAPLSILAGELAERLEQAHNERQSGLLDLGEVFATAVTAMTGVIGAAAVSPDVESLYENLQPMCPFSHRLGDQNILYPAGAVHAEELRMEAIELAEGRLPRTLTVADREASETFGVLLAVAAWPNPGSFWRGTGDNGLELLEPVYEYDYAAAEQFECELGSIQPVADAMFMPDGWRNLLDRVSLTLRAAILDRAHENIAKEVCRHVEALADTGTALRDALSRIEETDSGNDLLNVARVFAAQARSQADAAAERAAASMREVDQARRAFLSYAAAHLGPNAIDPSDHGILGR